MTTISFEIDPSKEVELILMVGNVIEGVNEQ